MENSLIAKDLVRRDYYPNVPSVKNFIRRGYHASVTVGNYIYIDGGEVGQKVNDASIWRPINHTLSLDMSKSWSNNSVSIRVLDKGDAPNLNDQVLWPSSDNKSFFAFGGEVSWLDNPWYPPDMIFWQFTADGQGGGSWSQFDTSSDSTFQTLTRPVNALGAVVDNTGYIIGGCVDSHATQDAMYMSGSYAVAGIASFNITSNEWNNDTSPSYTERPTGVYGLIQGVPNFGPAGLLAIAGTITHFAGVEPDPLNNITLYEPSSKKWYTQTATGNVPAGRDRQCTVGVKGDNGTYEIFIYGGNADTSFSGNMTTAQEEEFLSYDEVYVLSLPAFAWFKADYPAVQSRQRHTCEVFNRQMVSIGGYSTTDNNLGYQSVDRFAQGLAIFDLTAMQWKSSYDADAEPYVTPDVVKAWYRENGTSSVQWSNPTVRQFFEKASTTDPGTIRPTLHAFSPVPSLDTGSKSKSSNTGAIAGGVVGGVVVLGLLAGLLFWFLRHKRITLVDRSSYRLPKEQPIHEMPTTGSEKPQELPLNYRPHEMPASELSPELEGKGKSYLMSKNIPVLE